MKKEEKQPVTHRVRFSQIQSIYNDAGTCYIYGLDTRGQIWMSSWSPSQESFQRWTKLQSPFESTHEES